MQETLFPNDFPNLTCSVEDFLARVFQLPENEKGCPIQGARYFLKYAGLYGFADPQFYCLKMCKGFCPLTEGGHSQSYSIPWMNWGMMSNGKCLTARVGYHRTDHAPLLSELLEPNPDPKYFLSEKALESVMKYNQVKINKKQGFHVSILDMDKDG